MSTPATQKRRRPRDTGGTPGRTSDPLAVHVVPRLPRKSGGEHPTPWQCTLSHACHAKAAETKGHRRDARAYIRPLGSARCPTPATQKAAETKGHRRDARAYIRPLGSARCPTPATQKRRRPRDTGGTPGRTSDPLAVHVVPRLPRKSGGDQGTPEGRQGVHPTPWQCTFSHACHAKVSE